jgi:hypothetical protein
MAIELQSLQSLFIEMLVGDNRLATGTAFCVQTPRGHALITNRHNVTGRHQTTGQPLSNTGGLPDSIRVHYNERAQLGSWIPIEHSLYDMQGNHLWREHPVLGPTADFVALPVNLPDGIDPYPYSLGVPQQELKVSPSEVVSIIGFPLGFAAGGLLGVWVSGFVASEMEVDYENLPVFLVDCRGRPGQSGSPVIMFRVGMCRLANGDMVAGGPFFELLGIYSGRLSEASDLGRVWKRSAIKELVDTVE